MKNCFHPADINNVMPGSTRTAIRLH